MDLLKTGLFYIKLLCFKLQQITTECSVYNV